MAEEVADLYTVLKTNDAQFLEAAKRDTTAQEEVATAAKTAGAETEAAAAKGAAATEESAAAGAASTGRWATGWRNLTSEIEKNASRTQQVWQKVTTMGKVSAVGLLAVGVASVKFASDFQAEMELVHTQAGASQHEVDALSKSVLALAPTVGIGPEKLAEGLYHIESTGIHGAKAMDILAAAAKGAAMGMADLDTMSKAVSGVMSTAPKDITSASDAVALLNSIVGAGDMRMEDLVGALSTGALPAFKSAGLGARDFGAALATLTDNGETASEAATRLRMTVALMTAPSLKAREALASVGISSSQLAEDMQKPNGLLVAVQDLRKHLAGLGTVKANQILEEAFGGGRSSAAIMTLVQSTGRLAQKYEDLGTSTQRASRFTEGWQAAQKTTKQQLHELGAQVETMGVQLGQKLLPPLTHFVGFLTTHKGALEAFFVVVIAGMAAFTAAIIANTVAALANPVVWIIIGIVAAIALLTIGIYELVKHWKTIWRDIKKIALDVWHAITHGAKVALDWLKHNWQMALSFLTNPFSAASLFVTKHWGQLKKLLLDWVHDIGKAWSGLWHDVADAVRWAYDHTLKPIFDAISGALSSVMNGIGKITSNPLGSIGHLLGFGNGGYVPGPPGAPQLAVVHGGELVLSRDMLAGRVSTPTSVLASGGGTAAVPNVTVVNHNAFYVDGRKVLDSVTTAAQRRKGRMTVTQLA